jgi:hypothetical protein
MRAKLSISRWVACAGVGMCIGFLYFESTLLLSHRNWYHKLGEGPAASQWLDALDMVMGDFPFGHWVSDGSFSYLLNGLFWAALGSGLCALRLWRKHAA